MLGVVPTASDKEITRRLPQAGQGAPPRRQSRAPRSGSRRSARPTTSWATPRSARSTTRSAATGRSAAASATPRRRHVPHGGHGGPERPLRRPLRRRRQRQRPSAVPQRGADMEAQLHLSFQDAVHGVDHLGQRAAGGAVLELPRQRCRPRAPRRTPARAAEGRGASNDNQGLFSLSTVCPDCVGRGTLFDTPVPRLPRDGHRAEGALGQGPHPGRCRRRTAHPGQGTRRARAGHGAARRPLRRGPRGASTPVFGRSGRNLTITVPVTFPEAALGTTVTVPTLDGKVTLKVPAGDASRAGCCGCAAAACRAGRGATGPSRAICWSRWTSSCRPSSPTSSAPPSKSLAEVTEPAPRWRWTG